MAKLFHNHFNIMISLGGTASVYLYVCVCVLIYPCEVHAQFELRQQMEDDAPLVIQDSEVFLLIIFCVCDLLAGVHRFWAGVLQTQTQDNFQMLLNTDHLLFTIKYILNLISIHYIHGIL